MKKCIGIINTMCILMLILVACNSKEDKADINELDTILTKKYDISELMDYFGGRNGNESVFSNRLQPLDFNDVNQHFPIEVVRPEGYSVYAVNQGGYFYVFWSTHLENGNNRADYNPFVYFSAYLSAPKELLMFESLKAGTSTAKEVKAIDPAFELQFMMSSGLFSYSILNEKSALQIEYVSTSEFEEYDDLIVKNVKVISRGKAPAEYSSILAQDFPACF